MGDRLKELTSAVKVSQRYCKNVGLSGRLWPLKMHEFYHPP